MNSKKTFMILSIIAIVALLVIVMIQFNIGFIPCKKAEEINSILAMLCSGYLGGFLTYAITVFIPSILEYRKVQDAKKKSFAIIAEIVTGHIVAYFNSGIRTGAQKITADDLMKSLNEHPLYEPCIVSQNDGTLCERIWQFISSFQRQIMEYHAIWGKYLCPEEIQVLSDIESNAFYRVFNDNFSFYNIKPTVLEDGQKVFLHNILGKSFSINESGYNEMIKTEMNNLLELVKLVDKYLRICD